MVDLYSKKVMEYFHHPKNMGEIKNADGIGKVGNPTCGDLMWIYLKVGKNKKGQEIIKDIKVKTFGCVAAIASSSVTTALVKGKTLAEAEKITKDDVAKALHGLPPIKLHCSVLSIDALKEAIKDYKAKKKK